MQQRQSVEAITPIPRWLVIVASVGIGAHLFAIGGLALAAQSGPWAIEFGSSMAMPPRFAQEINDVSIPYYLRWLRLTHNYHFPSNRPEMPGVFFEAELKDDSGNVIKTVKFPDDKANFWLRHRQLLLARALFEDLQVQPQRGEAIAPPKQMPPSVEIWEPGQGNVLRLRAVPEHLVPRDRTVFRPAEWSRLLARSYARYLCRMHGAASAEIIRHTKDPILSGVLLEPSAPSPEEFVASFGEVKR